MKLGEKTAFYRVVLRNRQVIEEGRTIAGETISVEVPIYGGTITALDSHGVEVDKTLYIRYEAFDHTRKIPDEEKKA